MVGYDANHPFVAGLLLAAFTAAIVAAFAPGAIIMSNVLIDEILARIIKINDKQRRFLYTLIILVVSVLSGIYVGYGQMTDILPFLYLTAFPCTAPITVVILFGLFNQNVKEEYAFWSIVLGVSVALIWGLILDNPLGVPNIYISFLLPILIMGFGVLKNLAVNSIIKKTTIKNNP
jgi:Na+/proline symporter